MLSLTDPRWQQMKGGYRIPYDASPALRRLSSGEDVWDELWENLHHQGDVGEASYAAVPQLTRICAGAAQRDWNLYALVATIEVERHRRSNPPIPEWLDLDYRQAWREIQRMALEDLSSASDPLTVRSALGAVALARKDLKLGALLTDLDRSEIEELLQERLDWSRLYG